MQIMVCIKKKKHLGKNFWYLQFYRLIRNLQDLVDNEQVLRSQAVDNLGNLELGVAFDRQADVYKRQPWDC